MSVFVWIALSACLVTAGVLLVGIGGFGTGKMTPRGQNRIMRLRIFAQLIAVILILVAIWATGGE